MKTNTSTVLLRFLSIAPAVIALVVLAFAALFTALALRESLWILFALSAALVVCATILLRCSYLAWRRPSPATVREVCQWSGFALLGIAFVAFERLHTPGSEWLAWSALGISVLAVGVVETWLTRFLLRRAFGPDRLGAV